MGQYTTPIYALPYCDDDEPAREWPGIQKRVSERIEQAFKDAQMPPGDPSQNAVVSRLNSITGGPTRSNAFFVTVGLIGSDQPLTQPGFTAVTWNTRGEDTFMNPTATATRLVAPVPGLYQMTATLVFQNVSGGVRGISFMHTKNDGSKAEYRGATSWVSGNSNYAELTMNGSLRLAASEYIEVRAEVSGASSSVALKAGQGTRATLEFKRP